MNYYPFHVGDYAAHTAHLEPMEDLAYRRMLDAYYLRECPLPADAAEVARLVRMRSCVDAVQAVLDEFFVLTDEGWTHARCDAEIHKMQDKQAKAKASAEASVNARKAFAQRTLNERSTDVQLPTPTPTPTANAIDAPQRVASKKGSRLPQDWKLPKAWGDWAVETFPQWSTADVRAEADKFRDFWVAKSGAGAAKLDWEATWRNWCRNAKKPETKATAETYGMNLGFGRIL